MSPFATAVNSEEFDAAIQKYRDALARRVLDRNSSDENCLAARAEYHALESVIRQLKSAAKEDESNGSR